jgi:hypothetical protein
MGKTSLKLLAVGLFLLAAMAITTVSSASKEPTGEKSGSSTEKGKQTSQVKRENCSFLKDPGAFNKKQEHIKELSFLTSKVATNIPKGSVQPVKIPEGSFIDEEIFNKMKVAGIEPAPPSTDEEFLRRVTLDLTGRIPTAEQVREFVADRSPDKRDRLIDSLIGSPEYVDRWTMWLGDLLQNTAFSTNVVRYQNGRNAFYTTIKQAIQQNTPYNQFVTSLLTSSGNSFQNGAVNYIVGGLTPMGPPQDTYDTLLVQTSNRFLGIETFDCLLCHDGQGHLNALNLWATRTKRAEAWGMAAFFSRVGIRRNVVSQMPLLVNTDIGDTPAGQYLLNTTAGNRTPRMPMAAQSFVSPRYLFTGETPATGETYRAALARFLTKDRQFARATVNYLWEHFFGLGIVDPPHSFDLARLDPQNPPPAPWTLQPSHPELLEKLTDEFIANNYNLQQIMRLIARSSAYQLSSRYPGEWKQEYTTYFARKLVRRLDAEEMHDAVARATGILGNYQVFGLPGPIQWAMQLPDTIEPIPYQGQPRDASLILGQQARLFLNTFERGTRDQVPRSNDPSILQGLAVMNSPFVNSRIPVRANGTVARLLATYPDNGELIEELYITILSRRPGPEERDQALGMLKQNRTGGTEDLMWVLLNKIDFLYNY